MKKARNFLGAMIIALAFMVGPAPLDAATAPPPTETCTFTVDLPGLSPEVLVIVVPARTAPLFELLGFICEAT